jgi:RNA methyltransferase, TrmH family
MKVIVSTQNKEVRAVAKLHTSKGRENQNKFIIEGLRACQSLIETKKLRLSQVYVTQPLAEKAKQFISSGQLTLVSDMIMERISSAGTPSGIVAVFEIPSRPQLSKLSSGIVLAQISDPGNMGTLIRSAAAMDYKTVVVLEGCDPWSPKVIQSTAGTIGAVDIFQLTWQELLENKGTLKLAALVVNGGEAPAKISKDSLIVVGNEAHGLPEEWAKECEQKITLPMPGKTESLNAAVAGSIAMYTSKK